MKQNIIYKQNNVKHVMNVVYTVRISFIIIDYIEMFVQRVEKDII